MGDGTLIRPMEERDVAFILDSWVRCWRDEDGSGVLPWRPYFHAHRDHFLQVIKRRARVLVEVVEDVDPGSEITGYLVYEPWRCPIVHWAFTKGAWPRDKPIMTFRLKGVMTRLLEAAEIDPRKTLTYVSCWTGDLSQILKRKRQRGEIWQVRHDPLFLSDPKRKERIDASSRNGHLRPQDQPPRPRKAGLGGPDEEHVQGE